MVRRRMICVPRSHGGANDDCILVRSHRVLHVRWNIQEASDRVTFEVLQIRRFAKADLQGALQHGNPGVRSVRVKIMESRGNEGRVSKRLAWLLASSFKYRPFGSV